MKQFDNTNSGILSTNERRQKDTHPTHSGTINIEGVEYWLSGWVREGRPDSKLAGKKYLSLSVRRKDTQPAPAQSAIAKAVANSDVAPETSSDIAFDDDIPF